MIVEDNPVVQRMVTHIVSRQGHYTKTADNGHEALKTLSESEDEFDLIITDAKMPELDGMGLIDAIRALPKWSAIPFILMTAYLDIYEYISPEQMSGITILTKPISSQELREVLKKVLEPNGAAAGA
jgi:CheY-like chemotaxis protein